MRKERLERGVYVAPYLVDDSEVLIAIDSRGVARKHLKLRPGVSEYRAKVHLEQLLDRIDPRPPKLELVRESSPAYRVRPGLRAPLSEKQAYWRMLAKAGAAKIAYYG